ncbi:MAG: glycosyltransferase [Chthoniobacterales bacterium]
MDQTTICIAGAHRSGTSLLTRLLQQCGLYLGTENDMMPPAADNLDGFWENLRFVDLNDEVLSTIGAAWDLPPREGETFQGDLLASARAKADLLIERFGNTSTWGWKDPRNSLTLPFWRDLLPAVKTIIMVRNPLEVAYSMHKRNGTSYALGLRLWEIYNRRVMANTQPESRLFTSYQAFFDEPDRELQRIVGFAGLSGADTAAAASLVSHSRRHTSFSIEQMIDAGVSEELVRFFQKLVSERANEDKPSKTSNLNQLSGTPSRINRSVPDSEDVRKELATRRGDEIRNRESLARHLETIEGLRKELGERNIRAAAEIGRRDGRIEELQKAYAHLDETLLSEQQQRERVIKELNTLLVREQQQREQVTQELNTLLVREQQQREELSKVRDRFNQTNQLLQSLSVRLSTAEDRNVSLTDRLRKQLLELKKLLRILDQTSNAATLLKKSRRWKIANPFSALSAFFASKPLEGFGHLDNNVAKYHAWRQSHPEVESLSAEIEALRTYESFPAAVVPAPSARAETNKVPIVTKPPAPTEPTVFAMHQEVEVSIIIPVFNQIDYTLSCLAAVQQHSGLVPYEVIVVDDCSNDATVEALPQISGLTYLRSDQNQGFIASCNRGAAAARGQYLVFLNNDTNVTDGWLTALRATFDYEPNAGLVGSKLVYPDGRLQEAGGIIWRDGSGWNRGKSKDASDPSYNFMREVDYCSGASIMIPRSLFLQLGGFDSKYTPAYYEDVDLAFKVFAVGRKVLYQPHSRVIHYEGVTGGTDTLTGVKRHQEINRTRFAATWASVLFGKPENGDLTLWDSISPTRKRILVVDHHLPMTDRDAGSVRMFHIVNILHELGHKVSFLPDNLADIPPYGDELRKRGIEVIHHPYFKSIKSYLEKHGPSLDVVILSRCDTARKHIADLHQLAPQSWIIFDTVDLHHLRLDREAKLTKDPVIEANAAEKQRQEFELIDDSNETWVVSQYERQLLEAKRPQSLIEIVPTIVDVPGSQTPFALRHDFLFIGSFQHSPNADAVLYFAQEVFPNVLSRLPGIRFYVIGDKAPPSVVALASENIVITGLQPDVRPFFESVRLSVAPLRFGAGVKGKINQSMGFGVPVVATSLAVEGMSLTDGVDIVLADSSEDFAQAVIKLYQDADLWEKLSQNGLRTTVNLYSPEAVRKQLARLLNDDRLSQHRSRASTAAAQNGIAL